MGNGRSRHGHARFLHNRSLNKAMLLSPNTLQPFNNLRWRNPTMLRRLHNQTLLESTTTD